MERVEEALAGHDQFLQVTGAVDGAAQEASQGLVVVAGVMVRKNGAGAPAALWIGHNSVRPCEDAWQSERLRWTQLGSLWLTQVMRSDGSEHWSS